MQFRNEYYFLSNMYPVNVPYRIAGTDYVFPCAESAFQAAKAPNMAPYFAIGDKQLHKNGYDAKKAGRKVPLRPDWEQVKYAVMCEVVHAKFTGHPDLMARLRRTTGVITEENSWGDRTWGVCDSRGDNWLGTILTVLRDNPEKTPEQILRVASAVVHGRL